MKSFKEIIDPERYKNFIDKAKGTSYMGRSIEALTMDELYWVVGSLLQKDEDNRVEFCRTLKFVKDLEDAS